MKYMMHLLVAICVVCAGCCTTPRHELAEIQRNFTYQDKPVHPFLLLKFLSQVSDLDSPVVAVNVSATRQSNEFAAEVVAANGVFTSEREAYGPAGKDTEVVRYQHIATFCNDTQVILVQSFLKSAPNIDSELLLLKPGIYKQTGGGKDSKSILALYLKGYVPVDYNDPPSFEVCPCYLVMKTASDPQGKKIFAPK